VLEGLVEFEMVFSERRYETASGETIVCKLCWQGVLGVLGAVRCLASVMTVY